MSTLLFMYTPICDGGCNDLIGVFDSDDAAIEYANNHHIDEALIYADTLTIDKGNRYVKHYRYDDGGRFTLIHTGSVADYTDPRTDGGAVCPY